LTLAPSPITAFFTSTKLPIRASSADLRPGAQARIGADDRAARHMAALEM
jgi:hypothetical protein